MTDATFEQLVFERSQELQDLYPDLSHEDALSRAEIDIRRNR